jgi:hypothetical protein
MTQAEQPFFDFDFQRFTDVAMEAPKGRNSIAQGNALGKIRIRAPKP